MAKIFRVSTYLVDPNEVVTKSDIEKELTYGCISNVIAQQVHITESETFESTNDSPENQENCDMAYLERHFKADFYGDESSVRTVLVGGIYKHFKVGKLVKVIAISRDTEQIDKVSVVYEDLDNHTTWNRPYEMFVSEVDHEKYPDATQRFRFELVQEKPLKARFLQSVEIRDGKLKMPVNAGEIMSAIDRGDFYELRKKNGWGTMAPKSSAGELYQIIEDDET